MKMKELFDRGEFAVSAEVGPPKGIHVDELVEEAKTYLKGVHAVNVTDNQSSVMRLGSLAMCKVLKDAGMDPIFQLACRDRNRIALESDLLSAAMFGIENILCLTGDHTKMGDHPQAKPVFDLDSVSLLHTVKLLESGVDLGGNPLVGEPPKFSNATGIHDEHCRCSGHSCQIIGTGLRIDPAQSVIITHNAFYHGNIRILGSPFHQITGGLFIRKKGIQISGFCSQHTGMKHGIDVIRPAFKRRNTKSSLS